MRGAFLLAIPVSFALGGLRLGLIYVVALVVGSGSVFFEIGYQSYLPTLVSRAKLVRANS